MRLLILFLLPFMGLAQLPYSWTTNVDPGWVSSNPSNNTLSWQSSITTVSTSGFNGGTGNWYAYNNNQITTYTSPSYDFTSCNTSNFVQVILNLDINLENRYDWFYFHYSTDNGVTWINPVGNSASNNMSGVNLSAYPPQTAWANNASNRNGWTNSPGTIAPSFVIPKTANRFRFIIATDATGNGITIGFTTYIFYVDILDFTVICPTILPVDLVSFTGKNEGVNKLIWEVESETNCSHYTIDWSADGIEWETINTTPAKGSHGYSVTIPEFEPIVNYYRLSQTDYDGTTVVYNTEIVSIDNREEEKEIIRIINALGQPAEINTPGIIIIQYADGSTTQKLNP
jgi:hypothetical protein